MIYTTNTIKMLNYQRRKIVKNRGPGSFVLDVADGQPEELDDGLVVGEVECENESRKRLGRHPQYLEKQRTDRLRLRPA